MDEQWLPIELPEGMDPAEVDYFALMLGAVDGYLAGDLSATDLLLICVRCIPPGQDFLSWESTLWRMVTMHVAMYLAGDWAPAELDDSLAQISWNMRHELMPGKTVMYGSPKWKELTSRGQIAWPLGSPIWPKPPPRD